MTRRCACPSSFAGFERQELLEAHMDVARLTGDVVDDGTLFLEQSLLPAHSRMCEEETDWRQIATASSSLCIGRR